MKVLGVVAAAIIAAICIYLVMQGAAWGVLVYGFVAAVVTIVRTCR